MPFDPNPFHKWIHTCKRCTLHRGRTNVVVGAGPQNADVMLVGEGPGEKEDMFGEPFVGPAGHLLNRLLERAGLPREKVYITNIVKCRPPGNRDPEPEEVEACRPFLKEQIQIIQPNVLVSIGKHATWYLTGIYGPMGALLVADRDMSYDAGWTHIPVIPIYHPAYLLRQGSGDRARELFQDTVRRLVRAR